MAIVLVIEVEFEDDSDFNYFRTNMVGAVEDIAVIAMEGDEDEPARADGKIEVSWDVKE